MVQVLKPRLLRILARTAGIIAGLAAVAAAASYLLVTSGAFHDQVERHAASVLGRKTRIADVAVDWGWPTRLRLGGVEVANAGWGRQPYLLKAEQIDVEIRLWPLLKGELVVPSLALRKPEIAVEITMTDRVVDQISVQSDPLVEIWISAVSEPFKRSQRRNCSVSELTPEQLIRGDVA